MKNSQARGLDTNAVWVDARQMMTTRTSDTQTLKQAHKTHSQLAATHPELAYT